MVDGHKLIIHPGMGKTATSAIQSAGLKLPTNYPDQTCFLPYGVLGGAHNAFAANHPLFEKSVFDQEIEKSIVFIKSREGSTVLSSEFLIHLNYHAIENLVRPFIENGIDVEVVFGVRNYTGYLFSAYMQALKVKFGMVPGENLKQFCVRSIETIRYPMLLDRWARVLSDEKIFMLDFDEKRKTFVKDFFKYAGFDLQDSFVMEVNSSLSIEAANVLLEFDKVSHDIEARKKITDCLLAAKFNNKSKSDALGIVNSIVQGKYVHDRQRLTDRYTWV